MTADNKKKLLEELEDLKELQQCCDYVSKLEYPYEKIYIPQMMMEIINKFPKEYRKNLINKYIKK